MPERHSRSAYPKPCCCTRKRHWGVRQSLKQMAQWLAIDDLSYTEQNWPADTWEHWPHWREVIDEFLETLRFRHQLDTSFLEKSQ